MGTGIHTQMLLMWRRGIKRTGMENKDAGIWQVLGTEQM